MPKVKRSVAHARELRVLAYLLVRSNGSGRAVVSISRTALDTGLSVSETRGALKRAADNGLVRVFPRKLPNGASAENQYRLTQAGLRALSLAVCEAASAGGFARPEGGGRAIERGPRGAREIAETGLAPRSSSGFAPVGPMRAR